MKNIEPLLKEYFSWLKDRTSHRECNGWTEITTPYLDRHNDYIQIYCQNKGNDIILTDDGATISDLMQSGCDLTSPRRKALLTTTLNGFGVELLGDELKVVATEETFPLRKHSLLQAILAVNDLFYLARANVENFFIEDVSLWLDNCEIRYSPRITLVGHSRYTHQFDFVIPKSKNAPERILRAINNPNKESAKQIVFSWIDTKSTRDPDSKFFAILNDRSNTVKDDVREALISYDIEPIPWSKREEYRQRLGT